MPGQRPASERGQAAAELVAIVPVAIAVCLGLAQLAIAGYALWSAGDAARAGARAGHVGGDAETAARSALPELLEGEARIEASGRVGGPAEVSVRVDAPALIPGLPAIPIHASAQLGPGARGG
jgi:hypothetical protein